MKLILSFERKDLTLLGLGSEGLLFKQIKQGKKLIKVKELRIKSIKLYFIIFKFYKIMIWLLLS